MKCIIVVIVCTVIDAVRSVLDGEQQFEFGYRIGADSNVDNRRNRFYMAFNSNEMRSLKLSIRCASRCGSTYCLIFQLIKYISGCIECVDRRMWNMHKSTLFSEWIVIVCLVSAYDLCTVSNAFACCCKLSRNDTKMCLLHKRVHAGDDRFLATHR